MFWQVTADVIIKLMVVLSIIEVGIMIIVYIDNHKATQEDEDMIKYDCIYACGDEDCDKCGKRGILLNGCPEDCKDFVNHHGENSKGEKVRDL